MLITIPVELLLIEKTSFLMNALRCTAELSSMFLLLSPCEHWKRLQHPMLSDSDNGWLNGLMRILSFKCKG